MVRVKMRKIRKAKGISQTHLSKALGYKYCSGYANIEMGRNRLTLDQAKVIAKELGVPIDELLDDEKADFLAS